MIKPRKDRCDIDERGLPAETISAAYYPDRCSENAMLPDCIWLNLLAAECLVRSVMPPLLSYELNRCNEVVAP
jgi:hypothetical protein